MNENVVKTSGLTKRYGDRLAVDRVDLADRGDDKFKSYSLGMKQRLGVASALMGDPELIILDEPTNGLDPAGMADMRALIVELARSGQSMLLSSHLLDEVQEICDRVGVINKGRLLKESTVADLRGAATLRVRGVDIRQIGSTQRTLESVFFEMTADRDLKKAS